jgi:hypothetical protein
MKISEYFRTARGRGVIATADGKGKVDVAIYASPHVVDETTVAFLMPDKLTHANLSKDFLLKLMQAYQYAWITMSGGYYDAVKKRYGAEVANQCELASWIRVGERVNPRYAKMANIQLNTVLDSLKVIQLAPDGHTESELFGGEVDIKSPNHVISTTTKCITCEFLEAFAPDKIKQLCYTMEQPVMERFLHNPKIKVKPLQRPPRKSPDEPFCRWELKIEE